MLAPVSRESDRLCQKVGISNNLALLENAWESEMGSWREMAHIVALDNFSLVVEVESSALMQEITLRRKELMRRLNSHFGVPFIKNLLVRITRHG